MIPRTLSFPVLLLFLLSGCASLMQTPDAPVACGLPHCSLTRVEGVRVVTEDGERFLVHAGSAMRVAVAALPGTPETGTANVDAVLAEWRPRLAPVVAWDQAPQEVPGFVVRGLSGDLRPPPASISKRTRRRSGLAPTSIRIPARPSSCALKLPLQSGRRDGPCSDLS